jgi:hypothetical protein
MSNQLLEFEEGVFAEACSSPWLEIEIGGVESVCPNEGVVRANHVFVRCEVPFVLAATALETSEGGEYFGICVIHDPQQIDRFVRGPYPPHSRPSVLSLREAIGGEIDEFLAGDKRFSVLRRMVENTHAGITTLTPIEYGIVLQGGRNKLCVYADDVVPMSLCITWNETLISELRDRAVHAASEPGAH